MMCRTPKTFVEWVAKHFRKIPRHVRGHLVAVVGEFVGTLLFLFFGFAGVQVAKVASNPNEGAKVTTENPQKTIDELLYISLSFGFSLAVNAWVFFRISGGLFTPAVTVGMWLIKAISTVRMILLSITQFTAAIIAAAIVNALFAGGLNVNTQLDPTTSIAQGVIIEILLTSMLVFTIFMLAAEKHSATFIAPIGIGLSLFVGELVGVFWTGGSLNPARSLGPEIISGFERYDWIYYVGPFAGSILAVLLFKLVKALHYEDVNQDVEDIENAAVAK